MQVQRHETLIQDIKKKILIPSDMEYREEADEFFQEMNNKILSLPVDRCLSFGTVKHLSQNKI